MTKTNTTKTAAIVLNAEDPMQTLKALMLHNLSKISRSKKLEATINATVEEYEQMLNDHIQSITGQAPVTEEKTEEPSSTDTPYDEIIEDSNLRHATPTTVLRTFCNERNLNFSDINWKYQSNGIFIGINKGMSGEMMDLLTRFLHAHTVTHRCYQTGILVKSSK